MIISHSFLFRMRPVPNKSCTETQNTQCVCNNLSRNPAIYEIMWKKSQADNRRQYNNAHSHCMLDNRGHKHTLSICNTYYFTTTTTVTRTPLGSTSYVLFPSRTEGLYLPDFQTDVHKVGRLHYYS